jgi:hypothetical protein
MKAKDKNKMKISKEQVYTMERAARRTADIECNVPHFKHKAHKSIKDYTRKPKHKKAYLGD